MRSTKLRRKVLAGILCAAMVFQSVPTEAAASEAAQTVQEENSIAEEGIQEENQTSENNLEDSGDVPEISDITESSDATETLEEVETPIVTETPAMSETADITTEAPDGAEDNKSVGTEGTEEDTTEVSDTESSTEEGETEETEQKIELFAEERPDYRNLLSVVTENRYFYYEHENENVLNKVEEIFLKLEGCEIQSDVIIEFYLDDRDAPIDSSNWGKVEDYYVISLLGENITEGSHKLTVKLKDNNENSATNGQYLVSRENIEFTIEKVDSVFTEADKYYISSTDDSIEVAFFNPSDDIESVQITAPDGNIIARSNMRSTSVPQKEDPRYVGIGEGYEYSADILYKTLWVLPTEKNALEVGNYDIRLTLEDGTERMIPSAVEVSSRAVVTKCTLGTDYDNTSGFVYLYIQGSGFNPSQIRYDFEDVASSATLSTTRIDYKTVQSGYVVKFRKEGNWDKAGKEIKVSISKRSGNINFTQTEFEVQLESGIYYAEYNNVLGAVEVGVTTDLNGKAVRFSIVDGDGNLVSDVTSRALTESLAYLTPTEVLPQGTYYVRLQASGNTYPEKEFKVGQTSSTSHWDAPKIISKNAERHDFYYYSTEAGISNDGLKASIDGYNGDVAIYASEWLREDDAKGTRIQLWIPTRKLSLGQHTVRITRDGASFVSYTFEIIASDYDKFILDKYSLSWIDDSTIQVYMKTPNCAEDDDYDIKLTGINDRESVNISTEVTDRYADSVYMNITGLKKSDAYKDYYVLITHKKYGLPVQMEDLNEKYYTDEDKGERKSISSNKGLPVMANNRVIGINIQNMALPATLTIYAVENTDVIAKITIPSTVEGNYYYFTKDFYDSLVNKDRLYDMTISDYGENWARSYARINIGYKDETAANDIDVKISSPVLYIDGAESEKSAIITVTGNTQKPVFEVSDDEIVGLEDYKETSEDTGEQTIDTNKKQVVAKSTGTTFITIIADGVEKSIFVTVTKKATGITLNTSNRNMKVGDSFEVEAFIQPQSAKDPTQVVNFISSNSDILYVNKLTDTTARVTALRAGTAVLRATLAGTTYTVSVNISITGSLPLYDKKEIKIKEVGTVAYIENVDRSLSYCKLPEGWEWNDGELSLTAGDTLQYCWATYTEEGYQPFSARLPVAVTRIVGIDASGRTLINRGQKEKFQITYEYVGADINTKKFLDRIEVKCNRTSQDNIAELDSLEWDNLVIAALEDTAGGTADFALTLSIDNGTTRDIDLFVKEFSITVPEKDCVNNVKVIPAKASGQNFAYIEDSDLMEVDVNDVKTAKNNYAVELKASATINGVQAKNIKFNWKSSDNSIASVGVNKSGAVILTIKKAGYVEITAIADDIGKCEGTLAVNIMDYAPVLETPNLTINKYAASGTKLVIQEQNGSVIRSMRVLENDADSQNFSVSNPVEGVAKLVIKANAPALGFTKKTVSKCVLNVVTSKGTYKYDLKITTDVAKPAATLKLKSKANLFYTNAEAVYAISSKYDILAVEDVTGEEPGAERVRFYGTYDRSSGTIRFNSNGTLDSSTLSQFTSSGSPSLNVKLKVTFAGYSEPQTITVKVATENKKPSLSMTGMVTCPGIASGTVRVANSKTKDSISLDTGSEITIVKPTGNTVSAMVNKDGSIAVVYSGAKSVSYTAELTGPDWTQTVNAKGKITYVRTPDKMSLALESKQVVLNMGTNIEKNGVKVIPVSVTGSDIPISSLRYDGTAVKLIDADYLVCNFSAKDQNIKSISLGLKEGNRGTIKAGNYKLNLYAKVNLSGAEVEIKKATLTIKLTETAAAKVAFTSSKGKINLIDRANTSVVYTPKISGIDSPIKSVHITGDNAEYFTAELMDDGKVQIKANAGKSMMSNSSYAVTIVSTLQNEFTVQTVVNIKPVNKLPKVVFTPAKCNLYRSNNNKYTVSMSLKNSDISLNNIIGIKIDTTKNKNANNFALVNNISKDGTVAFNLAGDRNRIKKGQYKIKCLVTFRDAGTNTQPAVVNMVITVK